MNFFKCSLTTLLLSATFVACQKEEIQAVTTPQSTSKPKPAPAEQKPIVGLWVGYSVLTQKSIPVYFCFNIKDNGRLDVLNAAQQVIGEGTWTFNGEIFKTSYSIEVIGGKPYSASGAYVDSPSKLSGTWGFNNNDSGGGFWKMEKVN